MSKAGEKATTKRPAVDCERLFIKGVLRACPLNWHVVHTFEGSERSAFKSLTDAGFVAYLPMVVETRVDARKGKKYDCRVPLYPGYLFVAVDRQEQPGWVSLAASLKSVGGIVSLAENGAPLRVCASELEVVVDSAEAPRAQAEKASSIIDFLARLPEGGKVGLVRGAWHGLDITVTGYSEAKERVNGMLDGENGKIAISVPLDDVVPV